MSKELYDQLQKHIEGIEAAMQVAQDFADKHGLILELDLGNDNHYMPNVPFDQVIANDTEDRLEIIEMSYEDEASDHYNENFRGKWVTSSDYCY